MNLASDLIYAIGAVVCHQLPDRSFFWGGQQLPVCARCTGLYLSGVAGLVAWIGWKAARGWRRVRLDARDTARVLTIAALPTAISVAAGASGVWDGTNVIRAILAIPLGVSAGAVVAAVAAKDLR